MNALAERLAATAVFAMMMALTLLVSIPSPASELTPRKSAQNGVTVTVTPVEVGRGAQWAFKVALDTHSQDLADDLTKSASLIDTAGARYAPVRWEGAAPGGHHREGLLYFPAMQPVPTVVELEIRRPGESSARSFKWQLQ